MVAFRKALRFGVMIWLLVFVVAFAIFPLRTSARPLFESIMPVVLAAAGVFFTHRYFRHVQADFVREGLLLGLVWLVVNVAIDLPLMLSASPMQMGLADYVADIGITYLMLPVITTGVGWVAAQATSPRPGSGTGPDATSG